MQNTLTKKQKLVLNFITSYQKKNGFAPSLVEVQQNFKLASVSTAHFHVQQLQKKGLLIKSHGHSRAISAIELEQQNSVAVPLLGNIAAGYPIEAIEDPNERIFISGDEIDISCQYYALRVRGNSMIDEGIFHGDLVLIQSQSTAANGQTVVAIIDGNEATLKKIYKERDRIRLEPANKQLKPFYRKDVQIRGVVKKIIRNLAV